MSPAPPAVSLPTGVVTFLFTDVEGSTQLLNAHPDAYRAAVTRHHDLLAEAVQVNNGVVFETVGDAVYAAFARPTDAVAAALWGQLALQAEEWGPAPIRVRMGLHLGEVERQGDHYFGAALYRCARLMSTAHGGQVVLSEALATLVRDALPDGAALKDLGEHQLKDLARPEHAWQLLHPDLPATFPPLRSLDTLPNNLPRQSTPFVGREAALATVRERLLQPDTQLLTLLGPGGTGKTRLALQAAADLLDVFHHGVYFVPLAPVPEPAGVLPAIAQALGVEAGHSRTLEQALATHLRDQHTLLVLDNFEHVADAAPAVAALLSACPRVKALATSRTVLHVYGEQELPVPPMDLPRQSAGSPAAAITPERLSQYEAVRLFIDRARAVRADFAVTNENAPAVAEICARLDGLPLAIELAASRLKILPAEALLARLEHRLPLLTGGARNLPARQQTLRNAIAWSYDLLSPDEQRLFRRLGVFAGGCSLDAAEAVCAAEGPRTKDEVSGAEGFRPSSSVFRPLDVFDGLASLADKSLLRQEELDLDGEPAEPRFVMLATIAEFAQEQLEASGEAPQLRDAHAAYFLAFGLRFRDGADGPRLLPWLQRADAEIQNLRLALDRLLQARAETGEALRLARALQWFWTLRPYRNEIVAWLKDALPRSVAAPLDARLAGSLAGAFFAYHVGDTTWGMARAEEAVALARQLGDAQSLAHALWILTRHLGMQLAPNRERIAAARAERAAVLSPAAAGGEAWARRDLLRARCDQALDDAERSEDWSSARALCEEHLALVRTHGNPIAIAVTSRSLTHVAIHQGDFTLAARLAAEDLATCRAFGDRGGVARALMDHGRIAYLLGRYAEAAAMFRESLANWRDVGGWPAAGAALQGLAACVARQGDVTSAARHFSLAAAAAEQGMRAGADLRLPPAEVATALAAARQALAPEAFAAAWSAGQTLTLEHAIRDVLLQAEPAAAQLAM